MNTLFELTVSLSRGSFGVSRFPAIGNANSSALLLAKEGFQVVTTIGIPESRIIFSQIATCLACSPKSNTANKVNKKTYDLNCRL